jgi:hypothetical protein
MGSAWTEDGRTGNEVRRPGKSADCMRRIGMAPKKKAARKAAKKKAGKKPG